MFTKMFGPPPLANDYSYADRIMNDRRSCCEHRKGRHYSRPRSPKDVTHILALHMHGGSVGCEITGRRTLVGCEIT